MNRITDSQLSELLSVLPRGIPRDLALDLKEARERIAELERLLQPQEAKA